jgi:hypothetical protein
MGDYLRNVALRLTAAPSLRPRVPSRFETPAAFAFGLSRAHSDWDTGSESVSASHIRPANPVPERTEPLAAISQRHVRMDRPDVLPHATRDNLPGSQSAVEPARITSILEKTIVRESPESHRRVDSAESHFAHPENRSHVPVNRSEGTISGVPRVHEAKPLREEGASVRRENPGPAQPRPTTPHMDRSPERPAHPVAVTAARSASPDDHSGHFALTRPAQPQPEAPRADAAPHVRVVIGKVTVNATLPSATAPPAPRPAAPPPSRMTLERYLELRGGRG